jgi:hypothetical protein
MFLWLMLDHRLVAFAVLAVNFFPHCPILHRPISSCKPAENCGTIRGEEKTNMKEADEVLTPEQLAELRHRYGMLHISSVQRMYREAYERCAPVADRIPKAAAIQELVTVWKYLRSHRNQ